MKKHLTLQLLFLISFFLLVSVIRDWLGLRFISLWVGGLVGTLLADIDRLLYLYITKPQADISEEVSEIVNQTKNKDILKAFSRSDIDKKDLIFHSARFQLIFLLFTFWIVSSSNSLFGWGLALALTLHLLIDQGIDYLGNNDLAVWFRDVPFEVDKDQRKLFFWVNLIILLFLGLVY